MYCDEGFVLAGKRTFKCNLQKYDHDPSKSLCTKSKSSSFAVITKNHHADTNPARFLGIVVVVF